MTRGTLKTNVISAAGQTIVQTAVLFFLYRYLIDRLGIEQVGVWALVLATASATRISELGLAGSVTKFVASYMAQGDRRAASEAVQTAAISLAVFIALVLLVVYPGLVFVLPRFLPAASLPDGLAVLPYAMVSMWLGAVSGIWLSGLDGSLRSDLRAGLVILSTVLFVAMVVMTVPQHGLVGLAASQVGQGVVLVVLGWVAVRRSIGQMPLVPMRWSRERFREMLGYGANVQVMTAVMLLFEPTTKFLFARYGGLSAVGHFELAQQVVMKVRALIVESNRVVVPVMAGLGSVGSDARGLYSRNIQYLVLLLTPLFAVLASVIPAISELWLGHYQPQFVIMGVVLTVAWYLNSVTAPAYFAYLGHGRLRWLTVAHLVLGVGNVLLGVALGPLFGWPGVIVAFAISLAVGGFIPVWTYHREHALSVRTVLSRSDLSLLAVCVSAAAVALGGYAASLQFGTAPWTRIGLLAATTTAIAVAAWRHPLAPDVRRLARRGSRGMNEAG